MHGGGKILIINEIFFIALNCEIFFIFVAEFLKHKQNIIITMEEKVCKEGIVRKIEAGKVWVEIVVSSACGGCVAKNMCNISEKKNEIIEAENIMGEDFSVGEQVQIQMQESQAHRAVLLGYLLPFIVLIVGLFVCYALTHIEWLSALVAFVLTAMYYLILKMFDKRLARQFTLYVSKKSE